MSLRVTSSEERLRLRSLQGEVNYRRAVACLRGLRADESAAKRQVAECDRAFWLEVSQAAKPLQRADSPSTQRTGDSLARLKHQRQLLAQAKDIHRCVAKYCSDQLVQVQRYDQIREKASEAQTISVQRRSSRLQSRIDDEVCESATLRTFLPGEQEVLSAGIRSNGIEKNGVCPSLGPVDSGWRGGVSMTPAQVRSAELIGDGVGFRLRLNCSLPQGGSAMLSLTSSQGGGVSAVVESPSATLVNRIHNERFAIGAALRARGCCIDSIKTKRSDDRQSQLPSATRSRARGHQKEGDEDVIA